MSAFALEWKTKILRFPNDRTTQQTEKGEIVIHLICRSCGLPFREDEGKRHMTVRGTGDAAAKITYEDPPYNWTAANGYCLTCWLIAPDPPEIHELAKFSNFEQN
jgi:hypothetical protein